MSFKFDMVGIENSTHIFTKKEKQQLLAQYESDVASTESNDFIPIINVSPDETAITVVTNSKSVGSGIYVDTNVGGFDNSSMLDHNLALLSSSSSIDSCFTNLTIDLSVSTDKNGGQNFVTNGVIDSAA